ncbi:hypothetical protein GCM10007092_13460 [Thermus composti]|uniref:Uncharacterized protein n=1 Tax=Thermus composti TaxID=532059 RepID=A0ABV6PY06_9DEIN|nr:hypothetical protein [Thermus composti]GGN00736.1 hypothetical protein GCM10007092_13460 [Thermus composti]
MEADLVALLSQYLSRQAVENLLQRAKGRLEPKTPQEWARLVEEVLWPELQTILPFREMPPPLKAWVRALKATPSASPPEEAGSEEEEPFLEEAVDLEDPQTRQHLLQRLARLEGVLGVVVAGRSGKEERFAGEALPLDPFHLLLRRQGYEAFYVRVGHGLLALRPVGPGYVGLWARKEANIGRLLHALRRLVPLEEVPE